MDSPATAGPGLSIADYLGVFRRRPLMIAIPFLICLFLGSGTAFLVTPEYESSATLEIADDTELTKLFQTGQPNRRQGHFSAKKLVSTVQQHVERATFLQPLVSKHGITEGFDLRTPRGQIDLYNDHIFKELVIKHVKQPSGPDIIAFTYRGQGPSKVAGFVTDVRDVYVEQLLEIQRDRLRGLLDSFRKQRETAETQLERITRQYQAFRQKNEEDLFYIRGRTVNRPMSQIGVLEPQLDEQKARLAAKRQHFTRLGDRIEQMPEMVPGESKSEPNKQYEEAHTRLFAVKEQIRTWLNVPPRRQRTHREVQKALSEQASLEELLEQLKPTMESFSGEVPNQARLDLVRDREAIGNEILELEDLIRLNEARLVNLRIRSKRSSTLEADQKTFIDQQFEARLLVNERSSREDLTRQWLETLNSGSGSAFRPLETPLPEQAVLMDPVFPNIPLFVIVSAVLGLCIGVGLAFVTEFLSAAFLTTGQVGRVLPVQVLGGVGTIRRPAPTGMRRSWVILLSAASVLFLILAWVHIGFFVEDLRSWLPVWVFERMQEIYGAG